MIFIFLDIFLYIDFNFIHETLIKHWLMELIKTKTLMHH